MGLKTRATGTLGEILPMVFVCFFQSFLTLTCSYFYHHFPSSAADEGDTTTWLQEGWLKKVPRGRGRWRRRYFVLRNSNLFYYETRKASQEDAHGTGDGSLGAVSVDGAQIAYTELPGQKRGSLMSVYPAGKG